VDSDAGLSSVPLRALRASVVKYGRPEGELA
jgi:hypothetical protein